MEVGPWLGTPLLQDLVLKTQLFPSCKMPEGSLTFLGQTSDCTLRLPSLPVSWIENHNRRGSISVAQTKDSTLVSISLQAWWEE